MTRSYQRVVLTGFMGAGKSTVGRLLAPLLHWSFVDADAHIEQAAGLSIAGLFDLHGEQRFREIEADAVADLLLRAGAVIALGGGAIETATVRARLREDPGSILVYLETPFDLSVSRCRLEKSPAVRPVLQDAAQLEERFRRRLPLYQTADLRVSTADRSPSDVAQTIAEHLRGRD